VCRYQPADDETLAHGAFAKLRQIPLGIERHLSFPNLTNQGTSLPLLFQFRRNANNLLSGIVDIEKSVPFLTDIGAMDR